MLDGSLHPSDSSPEPLRIILEETDGQVATVTKNASNTFRTELGVRAARMIVINLPTWNAWFQRLADPATSRDLVLVPLLSQPRQAQFLEEPFTSLLRRPLNLPTIRFPSTQRGAMSKKAVLRLTHRDRLGHPIRLERVTAV